VPFRHSPDYLLISEAAAAAFAVARLLHFGLRRRFPFLGAYLAVTFFYHSILSVVTRTSRIYFLVYVVSEPIIWCMAALSVREMFALVFLNYPGLRTAGRWALNAALTISVSVALLILKTPWPGESLNTRWLFYELALDRSVHFSLAVIIMILLVFLSRYPLHLDRNTYVASGFFSAMFLTQSVVRLVDSLSPKLFVHYADYSEVGFTALCLIGWGVMVGPAQVAAPAHVPANKLRETELLQQLESLNNILSRSVRR
jgi:hypothetical protein